MPARTRREQHRQTFYQHPIKQQIPVLNAKMQCARGGGGRRGGGGGGGGTVNMNSLLPTVTFPLSALRVAAVKPAPTCICTLNRKLPHCLSCAGGDR